MAAKITSGGSAVTPAITGKNISVVEGHAFNGSVATSQRRPAPPAILWRQSTGATATTSAGTVVNDGSGHFHVVGKHTYANPGQFAAKVAVGLKTSSAHVTAAFKAMVADAPLVAGTARKLTATLNQALTAVLGSFTDTDPGNGTVSHYSGVIHWGDGRLLLPPSSPITPPRIHGLWVGSTPSSRRERLPCTSR